MGIQRDAKDARRPFAEEHDSHIVKNAENDSGKFYETMSKL